MRASGTSMGKRGGGLWSVRNTHRALARTRFSRKSQSFGDTVDSSVGLSCLVLSCLRSLRTSTVCTEASVMSHSWYRGYREAIAGCDFWEAALPPELSDAGSALRDKSRKCQSCMVSLSADCGKWKILTGRRARRRATRRLLLMRVAFFQTLTPQPPASRPP